ncbi:hypothetical protein NC653_023694 [Populus alba x Populus x berolinensis]|uniref:O-methyltransferase dimerisation domain-containing protein n=1 Tax=Populus alba x Populus x berolinensis TaxID=444605 RepID=A0AAD6QB02_9ROSI|nr:hypothetical protein NC653_023694 [Populus alba x Populus x berolinensis]
MERTSRDSEMKEEEDVQAGVDIWKYVLGFAGIAVVKCAIELGIAEAIENHEGPMALSELSSTLGCVPFSLDRIMRFLVHHHFFKEEPTIQGTAAKCEGVKQVGGDMFDSVPKADAVFIMFSFAKISDRICEVMGCHS